MFGKCRLVLFCLLIVVTAATVPAAAQPDTSSAVSAQNQVTERNTPYHFSSSLGNFQVTWPGGCGQLKVRTNQLESGSGDKDVEVVFVHHTTCDRVGSEGEGCSVTATLGATDGAGGPAGRKQVLTQVRKIIENFGVKIVDQRPLKREIDNGRLVEGVEVRGTGADGQGEFWVRGLLYDHNIYTLLAWSTQGDLWDNAEFQDFFNEFLPYAE